MVNPFLIDMEESTSVAELEVSICYDTPVG